MNAKPRPPPLPRQSFIDLDTDDSLTLSPVSRRFSVSSRGSHHSSAQYAVYPSSARSSFHLLRPPGTARSDTSTIPDFAPDAPYQPPPRPRRPRPLSMIASPTFFPPTPRQQSPKHSPKLQASRARTPKPPPNLDGPLPPPPMSNNRPPAERTEILRKHRKLAQVFGESVGGLLWPTDDPHAFQNYPKRNSLHVSPLSRPIILPPADDPVPDPVLDISPTRHFSTPASPSTPTYREPSYLHALSHLGHANDGNTSPQSFIDLSDDEDGPTASTGAATTTLPEEVLSPPAPSPREEERRKNRTRLAKLHRFLGSRVPVELALGAGYAHRDDDLPPLAVSDGELTPRLKKDKDGSPVGWYRKRRSSLSSALPELERVKDVLSERERVLSVKRAHKMEQVFGARPPQTLIHSRPPTATAVPLLPAVPVPPPSIPPSRNASLRRPHRSHRRRDSSDSERGTSESGHGLLANDGVTAVFMSYRHSINSLTDIVNKDDKESLQELHRVLNKSTESFSDDDKDWDPEPITLAHMPTLAKGQGGGSTTSLSTDESLSSTAGGGGGGGHVGIKQHSLPYMSDMSDNPRRRSLPPRESLQSLASSTFSLVSSPPPLEPPNPRGFQARRKRAAKLADFFGVDYRQLFGDVLDRIERGVREEVAIGALRADEVEELMRRLRGLKGRRDEIGRRW